MMAVSSSMAVLQEALGGTELFPRQQGVAQPGVEAWDTRGYSDLESVLRGEFDVPQAVPEWLRHPGIEWDFRTGHRKRPGLPPWDASAPTVSVVEPRTPSFSSTAPPPKWQNTLRGAANVTPQGKTQSRAIDLTPSTAASTQSSPEKTAPVSALSRSGLSASDGVAAASNADSKRPVANCTVGPPGARGRPGAAPPTDLKPGEYEPVRQRVEETEDVKNGASSYREASMHGELFNPKQTHEDQQKAAYQILDACDMVTTLITKATTESNSIEAFNPSFSIPPPWAPQLIIAPDEKRRLPREQIENARLLKYSEEEKRAKAATRDGLKNAIRSCIKGRQKQDFELRKVEQRLVMQARHATTLTALATGGHEEEYSARLFRHQIKHSQYAALAALGTHQICRFKTFTAFKRRMQEVKKLQKQGKYKRRPTAQEVEAKQERLQAIVNSGDNSDDEGGDSDEDDDVQNKVSTFRALQLELEQVRERQKESQRNRRESFHNKLESVGKDGEENVRRSLMENFKDSDARQTHAEQLRQRAMAAMSDDKVAKNFSRLLEFIDNGQASMRKLLASVNRLDKREKLVMEQLQEQVAEECGEAVEDMVKVGVVPKELMQKVRQTEAVPMIGVQEVRAMQRRRDRLKAIQASIQSEIESTAIKKATDAAANKAYAEALRKGKDLERAEAEAAAASAAAREQAAEQTRSASMLLALNLKQPDKDENAVARAEEAAAQAKQAAEEGKAKAEAQRQYAEQKKKELAAMQGELGSNVAGASAGANAAGSAAAEAQKMMDTAASMSDGTKGTVTYKGKPLELPPRAVVTPGRQTGEATGEGPDSAASVQAGHLSPHNELPRKGDAEADRQMVSKLQSLSKQAQDVVGQIAGGLEAAGGKPDEAMTKLLKSVDQLAGAVDTACSGDDSISALSSEVLSNLQAGFDEFSVAGMKAGDMMMQIKDPIKLPEVAEVPEVRAQAGVSRGEARRRDEAAQSEEEARQSQEEEAAVAARRAQQAELESQTQKIYEQSSELELEHQAQRFKVEELQRLIAEMQAAQQAARTEAERQAAADEEAERAQLAAEEACKAEAAAAAVKQEADAQAAREAAREAAKKKEQDALEKLRQKIEQEALEAERLEDLIAALKAELAAKEALAATKRSTNLPEGEPKGLQVPSSSLEVDARAGSATPGSAGPQAGGMPGSSGSEDGGVPGSAGTQPQQLSAELADPFFQGEGSPTPGGSSSATGAFDLSSADGSSATGDNHTADNDSSAGATPSAKAGLRGLFKKAVTKVIDINLEEQDGQDNVEGGSQRAASPEDPPEDLLKEREDVICRELGVTQKVLRKDDKRTGFRLNMQKILKQRRHQLWLRTKVLLSFLSSEEVAGLTKAGVITGMPNQKGDPKNEGESTYESEEKRLNGRLQMLVNLIDFWSKRLEQARLMGDNDEDAANGMDPGNGELNSMANGFDAQGFMNMIGTPSGQFGDQSAGMPFNGAPHEIQQQQQMMFHNCQMMLANALNNGDMQQAQQIQQMITNLAVSMNGPGGPGGPGGATPRNLPGGQGNQLQSNMPGGSGVPGFNGPQGPPPGVMMTMQQMQQAGMMPAPGGHLTPQQIQQIQQMQQMQQAGMTMPAQGGMSMPFQAGPDGMGNQGGMTMPMQYGMMSPQAQQSAQLGMMMPGGPMGMTMPGVAPGAMMPGMTMPGGTMPGMAAGMPGAMMPGVTRGGVGYGRSNGMPGGQSFASDPAWQAAMNQSARRLGSARPSASGDPGGHPDMNFGGFPGDQQAMMAYHAARNGSLRGANLGYNNPFPLGADPLQIGNHAYGSQFAKFDQDRVFHNTNMLHSVHQTGFDGDPLHLTGAGHSDGFKRVRVNKGFYDAAFDPRFNPNPRFDPRFQNQVGLDVGYGDGGVQQMMRDAHLARNKAFHGKALHGMKNPLLEPGPRRLSGNARLDHQMKKNISYHARHFYKRKSNREQQFMMDFGMTGVAGANNGSYRMLNKQPFTMIGGKRVRNMMEGGLSISGVHLDDASNRSATSGFSFGNAATMPVMPGMRNKRDPGGLQVVGAYGQGAFNQGPIHQGVRGSLKRSSLTMALHASPEFDESNLGSIGSLTALSFGGPSAEQVHLADRFVRDILATAHVPVARDGLLSQLCLWLDDQERSAIRSHIWRIFAQPEPVQRLALKASRLLLSTMIIPAQSAGFGSGT